MGRISIKAISSIRRRPGRESKEGRSFDWIVGNPPWIELKKGKVSKADQQVWEWIQNKDSKKRYPVGGNQVAEAFAWKVMEHLTEEGQVALLLPAMTLFKDESTGFRKRFFTAARAFSREFRQPGLCPVPGTFVVGPRETWSTIAGPAGSGTILRGEHPGR